MSEADGFEKDAFSRNWRASGLDIQEKNEFAEQERALTQEQQSEEEMDTTVSENMMRIKSRYWRGLKRFVSAPVCILAPLGRRGCIILFMKLWITPLMRRSRAFAPILRWRYCQMISSPCGIMGAAFRSASMKIWYPGGDAGAYGAACGR